MITHKTSQENGECGSEESKDSLPQEKFEGKIAGLEPMNFITFATPHLGSRGHKQVLITVFSFIVCALFLAASIMRI